MERFRVRTSQRREMVDITEQVQAAVETTRQQRGVCHVFVPHTTCGVTLNERADPCVRADILETLGRLVPRRGDYTHTEGNSDAHLQATLTGAATLVPVENGRLVLGTWQAVFLCEFDGPRTREVWVTVISS